jgi:hypothetical protein
MTFMRGFIEEVVERGLSTSFEDYASAWIENAKAAA